MSVSIRVCVFLACCLAASSSMATSAQVSCVTSTSAGDHVYTCQGLRVDARIPATCPPAGCGLILEVHGDTGSGLLEDEHTKLRDRGAEAGFIVVAPTGSSGVPAWTARDDERLVGIVQEFVRAFHVDPKRVHVTGFSRGGFVTWRLACDHADLFASAAPAGASNGGDRGEATCFSVGHAPTRKIPLLLLIGRTDAAVGYPLMVAIRDAAIASYGARASQTLASDASYTHTRRTSPDGAVIEIFEHGYVTLPSGEWGWARGHCFPGSTADPHADRYAVGCVPPVSFNWGQEVVRFFRAHPMP